MGFFWRSERCRDSTRSVYSNASASIVTHMLFDPEKSMSIVASCLALILRILRLSGFAKIVETIICTITVLVIYKLRRPFPCYVEPCETMRGILLLFQGDNDAAVKSMLRCPSDRLSPFLVRDPG